MALLVRSRTRRPLLVEQLEARDLLATFTVTSSDDAGAGSLRQALIDANGTPEVDDIRFDIPGSGVHTIAPLTPLPAIAGIRIDATTQPGFAADGTRLIEISAANLDYDDFPNPENDPAGLNIGGEVVVRGLAINGFAVGISVHASTSALIEANYIGLDPTGMTIPTPKLYDDGQHAMVSGIVISNSRDVVVGGTTPAARNVIGGARYGIKFIYDAGDTRVIGNYIGADATGAMTVPCRIGMYLFSATDGIRIGEPGNGNMMASGVLAYSGYDSSIQGNVIQGAIEFVFANAHHFLIGGGAPGEGNRIGGIGMSHNTHHHVVQGNWIGVDVAGTARSGGGQIVMGLGAHHVTIGTDGDGVFDAQERNVIAGGVYVSDSAQASDDMIVAGNLIGVNVAGTQALTGAIHADYQRGVNVQNSSGVRIGTNGDGVSDDLERNIVSGGWETGISVTGNDNIVAGNYVGTDITGTIAIPNRYGVGIGGARNRLGTNGDGVSDDLERNVISGNSDGVNLGTGVLVAGNYIGVDATGLARLPNGIGIIVSGDAVLGGATGSTIGGTSAVLRNVISGNLLEGLRFTERASGHTIAGNYIGVDRTGVGPLGNGSDGVRIMFGGYDNTIGMADGATDAAAGNVIAHNGSAGVLLGDGDRHFRGFQHVYGNRVRGNAIFANGGLGIDSANYPFVSLGNEPVPLYGVTLNDNLDADAGANESQNFPVLDYVVSGATTRVFGALRSRATQTYVIDLYAGDAVDPTGYGEGRRWVGTTSVTTDTVGFAAIDAIITGVSTAAEYFTATATDAQGNTSEFSFAFRDLPPSNIALSNTAIAEGASGAVVGQIIVTDSNVGETFLLSVDDARFAIAGDVLQLKPGISLDYETSSTVEVTLTAIDRGGLAREQTFTLFVHNENEAPVDIQLANASVAENLAGATIGAVTVVDPDANDTFTFTVDDARFEVAGGQLKLISSALNHEAEPVVSLVITATDSGGLNIAETFTIAVTNVNDPPTAIALSNTAILENIGGAIVGQITVVDQDASDAHELEIDDARFAIDNGQLSLQPGVSLDHEATPSVSIHITATDSGGQAKTQTFIIAVSNVNEAPTDIVLSSGSVTENVAGVNVGMLTVSDPDFGNTHTFTTTDSRFTFAGSMLRLKPGESLNYENGSQVHVPITATDNGSPILSRQQLVAVQVTNVNEPPTSVTLSRNKIFANLPGAWVAQITVSDPDVGDTHTFALSDGRFTVTAGHLYLKPGQQLTSPAGALINLQITALDSGAPIQTHFTNFAFTVEAAPSPWLFAHQWLPQPYDVDLNGVVTPLDALLIINELNATGLRTYPAQPGGTLPPNFLDVSGDDQVTPLDALLIINYLNAGSGGEGESHANEADNVSLVDAVLSDDGHWSLWQDAAWDALVSSKRRQSGIARRDCPNSLTLAR